MDEQINIHERFQALLVRRKAAKVRFRKFRTAKADDYLAAPKPKFYTGNQ